MRQIYITILAFLMMLASQANAGMNVYWNPVTKDNYWNLDQTMVRAESKYNFLDRILVVD